MNLGSGDYIDELAVNPRYYEHMSTLLEKLIEVWLNLELAKKPPVCLAYVLVHEMVHFHERLHNNRFHSLMEAAMPQWRVYRDELNKAPLAYEDWAY